MIKLKHVKIVLKKELIDFLRDKRTLITSIFLPAVLLVVLFNFMGNSGEKLENDIKDNITISLTKESNTKEARNFLSQQFKGAKNIKLKSFTDPKKALKEDKVRILLNIENGFLEKLKTNKPFKMELLYDESKMKSTRSLSLVTSLLETSKKNILIERVTKINQSPEILEPFIVSTKDMSKENKSGSSILVMMLPMLLCILIAQGGGPASTDLIAGEKERNTFEPLLTTKASRMSILAGKYLTITILSFITVISSLIGYVIAYKMNPTMFGSSDSLQIEPLAAFLTILIMVTLGCTFSGISVTLSTYAKSFKEAQTYLGLLIVSSMIPAYSTMFMQVSDIKTYMFLIPVLNAIVSMKTILSGTINYTNLLYSLLSSLVYVIISLTIAVKMFNKEKVLFRS